VLKAGDIGVPGLVARPKYFTDTLYCSPRAAGGLQSCKYDNFVAPVKRARNGRWKEIPSEPAAQNAEQKQDFTRKEEEA
jgi:hypothetical protein